MTTLKIYIVLITATLLSSCKLDISPLGKWKVVQIRTVEDDDKSQILKIDLKSLKSITNYTDSIFMDGKFGKLKLDTSLKAIRVSKEMALNFEGLQNTYLIFNSDSTYRLDNQPMLFGFVGAGDSTYRKTIVEKWRYLEKDKWLSLKVEHDDFRNYRVVYLSKDSLVIDDEFRQINGVPIKELTLIRQ